MSTNETTEFWRDIRHERQERRASNKERGAFQLKSRGFKFEEKNDGQHLIVFHKGRVADYWPSSGRWIFRNTKENGYGVFNLMRALERA